MILFNFGKRLLHIRAQFQFKRNITLLNGRAHINGEWVNAASGKTLKVINPANNDEIGTVPDMHEPDFKLALESAKAAFSEWRFTTPRVRATFLKKLRNLIEKYSEDLAKIITLESGKPIVEARGEVIYGNSFVEWYAEEANRLRGEIIPSARTNKKLLVEKEPIGVALLITSWNFPMCAITRKIGPALAAGCTCIVKPSELAPLSALALAELVAESGIPKGVVNFVTCSRETSAEMTKYLLEKQTVAVISFTGSTNVGKVIYDMAAKGVKTLSLQLGGECPFMVFKSADIRKAVAGAMASKFRNCGQSCISPNKFLVHEEVHDEFVNTMKQKMEKLKVGNGMDETTQLGPIIRAPFYNNIAGLVNDAVEYGATLITGGKQASLGGTFYTPTLLVGIKPSMKIYRSEIFGPVVAVSKFKTEAEAINAANDTLYGLAAYVFSEDMHQIFRVVKRLDVGMVGINDGMISLAEAPFGGVKASGIGREGSTHGMNEFINLKFISMADINTTISAEV